MAHSSVFFDGHQYVIQVAHVLGANDLIDPGDYRPITGLLEYSLCPGDGMLRVYDLDDELHEVHNVEDWEGLDKEAVQALLDAVDGTSDVLRTNKEYVRVLKVYWRTGDPEKALMKHKIGTVVRIDYGEGYEPGDADVLIKRGENLWEASGQHIPWRDEEVEAHSYEVIYSV